MKGILFFLTALFAVIISLTAVSAYTSYTSFNVDDNSLSYTYRSNSMGMNYPMHYQPIVYHHYPARYVKNYNYYYPETRVIRSYPSNPYYLDRQYHQSRPYPSSDDYWVQNQVHCSPAQYGYTCIDAR